MLTDHVDQKSGWGTDWGTNWAQGCLISDPLGRQLKNSKVGVGWGGDWNLLKADGFPLQFAMTGCLLGPLVSLWVVFLPGLVGMSNMVAVSRARVPRVREPGRSCTPFIARPWKSLASICHVLFIGSS